MAADRLVFLTDSLCHRQMAMPDVQIDRGVEVRVVEFLDHVGADDPDLRCAMRDEGRHVERAHPDQAQVGAFRCEA